MKKKKGKVCGEKKKKKKREKKKEEEEKTEECGETGWVGGKGKAKIVSKCVERIPFCS